MNAASLEGALDGPAQFFVAPTLEKDAVSAKSKLSIRSIGWPCRTIVGGCIRAQSYAAKQDHPFSRFSTGSEQTLLEKAGASTAYTRS